MKWRFLTVPCRCVRRTAFAALFVIFEQPVFCKNLPAQVSQPISAVEMVDQMVQAETNAWRTRQFFLYRSQERSSRTGGHLWEELVVETSDGPLRLLISEDGRQLSSPRQSEEKNRIAYLASHPNEFRRSNRRRQEDEARLPALLRELPSIFLFKTTRSEGGYAQIAFQPNPSFHERSYQDRIVHAMSGVLIVHATDMRLSELDVHLEHRVEFGFGLLGEIRERTHFSLTREEAFPGQWVAADVGIYLDGSVLLVKSLSREVNSRHFAFKRVPHDLTVAQAAAILLSNSVEQSTGSN